MFCDGTPGMNRAQTLTCAMHGDNCFFFVVLLTSEADQGGIDLVQVHRWGLVDFAVPKVETKVPEAKDVSFRSPVTEEYSQERIPKKSAPVVSSPIEVERGVAVLR